MLKLFRRCPTLLVERVRQFLSTFGKCPLPPLLHPGLHRLDSERVLRPPNGRPGVACAVCIRLDRLRWNRTVSQQARQEPFCIGKRSTLAVIVGLCFREQLPCGSLDGFAPLDPRPKEPRMILELLLLKRVLEAAVIASDVRLDAQEDPAARFRPRFSRAPRPRTTRASAPNARLPETRSSGSRPTVPLDR